MSLMDTINLFLGFVVGVLSSWVFWYLLILTKPKISISPFVVFHPQIGHLKIRVINRARRQAADVKVQLFVAEKHNWAWDKIFEPKLNRNSLFALGPIQNLGKLWDLPTSTIFTVEDGRHIVDLLSTNNSGERRLIFTLSATDALSGSKVIQRVVYNVHDIKQGRFSPGLEFKVIENIDNQGEAEIIELEETDDKVKSK